MSSRRDLVGALTSLLRLIGVADDIEQVRRGTVYDHASDVAQRAERGLITEVPWTAFAERPHSKPTEMQIRAIMRQHGLSEEEARGAYASEERKTRLFINSRYQVAVEHQGATIHLSIKRIDQLPIHDWRDLQRIKNELVGPENEAVELYPANSRVVDTVNQYHLWVLPDADVRLPIGFDIGRHVSEDADEIGAAQRKRKLP